MEKHSYFGAGAGWEGQAHDSVMTTWLRRWPEYDKPLGEPLGPATLTVKGAQHLYLRTFASGTRVELNLTTTPCLPDQLEALADQPWLYAPGAHLEHISGQITDSCVHWADGTTSGKACRIASANAATT